MLVGAGAALYDAKRSSGVRVSTAALEVWAAVRDAAAGGVPAAPVPAAAVAAAGAGAGAGAAASATGGAEWLLLAPGASATDEVALKSRGVGWAAALAAVSDSDVSYILAPVAVGAATRYIFVSHCGAAVAGMKRARVSLQRAGVYAAFPGLVASVEAAERSDLEAVAVADKVRRAIGASAGAVTML